MHFVRYTFLLILLAISQSAIADACSNLSVTLKGLNITMQGVIDFCDDYRKLEQRNRQLEDGAASMKKQIEDLNSKISRIENSTNSISGASSHGEFVSAPGGSASDWNIHIAPKYVGWEEGRKPHDNAMIWVNCYPNVQSNGWSIHCITKFRYAGDGRTRDEPGDVLYILVPK